MHFDFFVAKHLFLSCCDFARILYFCTDYFSGRCSGASQKLIALPRIRGKDHDMAVGVLSIRSATQRTLLA